jgi:hypothetical protein
MPLVDVILPAGIGDEGLPATVASLAAHRDTIDWGLVVVRAGSQSTGQEPSEMSETASDDEPAADNAEAPADPPDPFAALRGSADGGGPSSPARFIDAPDRNVVGASSAAVDSSEARYIVVVPPAHRLLPGALGRLVRAAQRVDMGGAVGGWVTCDETGKPCGPEADAPAGRVDIDALLDGYEPAVGCVLMDRLALRPGNAPTRAIPSLGEAALLDRIMRLTEQGARLAGCESLVSCRTPPATPSMEAFEQIGRTRAEVIERAMRRAATLGFEAAGVDLSEAREREAVLSAVLRVATRAALGDPDPRCHTATELLRDHATRGSIGPELAAATAVDALRVTSGFRPTINGSDERLWLRALRGWWSRLVGERWADRELLEEGPGLLAELLVPRAEVASAVMTELAGLWSAGEPFFVAGDGPRARAMAGHAARAGCEVTVLLPPERLRGKLPAIPEEYAAPGDAGTVTLEPLGTRIGVDAPLVVIDSDGVDLLRRFAGRPNVVRWSGGRRIIVQRTQRRMREAWNRRPAAVG